MKSFIQLFLIFGCEQSMSSKIDNFPDKTFIEKISFFKIKKNDRYDGLLMHHTDSPYFTIDDKDKVREIYQKLIENYLCCSQQKRKTKDSISKILIRFSGNVKQKNVVLKFMTTF